MSVIDKDAHELARGLVHYSSAELEQIKGCNSGEIAKFWDIKILMRLSTAMTWLFYKAG